MIIAKSGSSPLHVKASSNNHWMSMELLLLTEWMLNLSRGQWFWSIWLYGFCLHRIFLQHGIHRYVGNHRTSAGRKTVLSLIHPWIPNREGECWACAAGERKFALLSIMGSETGKENLLSNLICIKCYKKVMELTLAYVTWVPSPKDL